MRRPIDRRTQRIALVGYEAQLGKGHRQEGCAPAWDTSRELRAAAGWCEHRFSYPPSLNTYPARNRLSR